MAKDIFSNLLEEKNLENEEIEIKRQIKKIDVLVVLKKLKKAYIIEDKTYTSEHSEQIKRYKETIKNEFGKEIDEIKTVYFKTGFWFSYDYNIANEKDKIDIKIDREDFLNISKSSISQYQFMRDIFSDGYIESGRSVGGRPYTQFNILRSVFPNKDNENLSEDKRNYTIFWRIDTVNAGPYISINFYTHHNNNKDMKPESRRYEYIKLKEKLEKIIKENYSDLFNLEKVQGKFSNYWEQNLLIIPLKDYLTSKEKCDKLIECIRIIDGELRK